jgi:excisionase family DNA binding protein
LENWKTTKEISELLKVSEETVRRWIRGGELKASLDGKSYVVKGEDLEKFILKKAKTSGTSISKMLAGASTVGFVAAAVNPILGAGMLGTLGIAALVNKGFKKSEVAKGESTSTSKSVSETLSQTIKLEDIEEYIEALQRKKKKIELEYQMRLLEIEDEIANYQKLKEQLKNGGI